MRGGSPEQFYELLFEGEEVGFTVNGKNYFSQGYCIDGVFYREVVCYKKEDWEKVFFVRGDRNTDFTKAFVKAPIFDGKTFWEVEEDIHWTTDEFEKYPDYDIDIYEEAIIPYRRVGNFHFKDSEEQIVVLLKEKNISFTREEVNSISILRTPKREISFFFLDSRFYKVEIREPFKGVLPNGIKIGISMKEAQYKDTSLVLFSDKEGIWKSDEGYFISEDLTNNTVGVITSGIKDMDLF